MQVIEKPWGVTRCIHKSAACEVWHASIRPGGASSWHRHEHKWNHFYVLSGELEIKQGTQSLRITSGHTFYVEAGEWHGFNALTAVELIETYWLPPIDSNDIVRQEAVAHGG